MNANLIILAAWLVLGAAGVLALVASAFRDDRAVEEALARPIDPGALHTPELKEAVQRARRYREAIRESIDALPSADMRASLATITSQFDDPAWLIYTLGRRIDAYRGDRLIQADFARLRAAKRAGTLSEPDAQHLNELLRLDSLINEANSNINATLAQLGTAYAEVQTIGAAGDIRGGRVQQSLDDLSRRAAELSNLSTALDEVYQDRPK